MDEYCKFTKITRFYFVKNKTYNKWITNDNNNNKYDEKEYDNNNKRINVETSDLNPSVMGTSKSKNN
jgi:hypothetical protein